MKRWKPLSSEDEDVFEGRDGGRERERETYEIKTSQWLIGYSIDLNVLHEFRIEKRETHKLRLIQVHHEQLVRGSQIRLLRGELFIEVAYVLAVFLRNQTFNFSSLPSFLRLILYSRFSAWTVAAPPDSLSSPNRYVGKTRGSVRPPPLVARNRVSSQDSSWGTERERNYLTKKN